MGGGGEFADDGVDGREGGGGADNDEVGADLGDLRGDEGGDAAHEGENEDDGGDANGDAEASEEGARAVALEGGFGEFVVSS